DVGIGFEHKDNPGATPEPLIQDLELRGVRSQMEARATKHDFVLLRELEELARHKHTVLELDDKLLDSLRAEDPRPLPDAFAVKGSLAFSSADCVPEKCSFYLHGVTGPSGATLLGRFCYAHDQLTAAVKEHLQAEEAARSGEPLVFAEVAHLPEG